MTCWARCVKKVVGHDEACNDAAQISIQVHAHMRVKPTELAHFLSTIDKQEAAADGCCVR